MTSEEFISTERQCVCLVINYNKLFIVDVVVVGCGKDDGNERA